MLELDGFVVHVADLAAHEPVVCSDGEPVLQHPARHDHQLISHVGVSCATGGHLFLDAHNVLFDGVLDGFPLPLAGLQEEPLPLAVYGTALATRSVDLHHVPQGSVSLVYGCGVAGDLRDKQLAFVQSHEEAASALGGLALDVDRLLCGPGNLGSAVQGSFDGLGGRSVLPARVDLDLLLEGALGLYHQHYHLVSLFAHPAYLHGVVLVTGPEVEPFVAPVALEFPPHVHLRYVLGGCVADGLVEYSQLQTHVLESPNDVFLYHCFPFNCSCVGIKILGGLYVLLLSQINHA